MKARQIYRDKIQKAVHELDNKYGLNNWSDIDIEKEPVIQELRSFEKSRKKSKRKPKFNHELMTSQQINSYVFKRYYDDRKTTYDISLELGYGSPSSVYTRLKRRAEKRGEEFPPKDRRRDFMHGIDPKELEKDIKNLKGEPQLATKYGLRSSTIHSVIKNAKLLGLYRSMADKRKMSKSYYIVYSNGKVEHLKDFRRIAARLGTTQKRVASALKDKARINGARIYTASEYWGERA
ncbi:hypothetical protein [Ligilactobacillus acidipiscis]|uniref:hypothetical protein n=1 Tax=Ligilactobacillus acidipiscis TaxID=89059 RepID=UPI0023F94F2E|nr:hypothetical protein [Ligilactobacillus acidipiscis]WEV56144.1 hypothetical protein OZX66_07760 [Ligilactobacillus acidipiscis]